MDQSITTGQWQIRTEHKPILGEDEQDALVSWLSGSVKGEEGTGGFSGNVARFSAVGTHSAAQRNSVRVLLCFIQIIQYPR